MPGVVFVETLRRNWRGMVLWGIGIAILVASQIVFLPNVDVLRQVTQLLETMPPIVIQALGGGDMAFLSTPEGYLAWQYFGIALLIFAIYAVLAGLNVTSAEEDRGILDLVLSLPIPRWRLVSERLAAYAVLVTGIAAISCIGIWLSLLVTPMFQIDPMKLIVSTLNILPGTLVVLTFTALLGAAALSRGLATAGAMLFVVGSYFIDFIGAAASGTLAASLRVFSFYRYYDSTAVIQHGLSWGNVLILLAAAVACALAALWFFERRDIR